MANAVSFEIFDSRGLARLLGVSLESVRQMRRRGTGPPCRKVGAKVLYSLDEVRAWWEALPSSGGQPAGGWRREAAR
jgi:hypothetical protein